MKVSGIDKDFIDIINVLNENGFCPWSSCDGVLAHHDKNNKPVRAYISFLKSDRIIDLMSALLRDKDIFEISLCSGTNIDAYDYFGNQIKGNTYRVGFYNYNGEKTNYFEKIIRGIISGKIKISDSEKQLLEEIEEVLSSLRSSELCFDVIFNGKYQPGMHKKGKTNIISIFTKTDLGYNQDMNELAQKISQYFGIPLKKDVYGEKYGEIDEFIVPSSDRVTLRYYFNEIDISKIIKIIEFSELNKRKLATFIVEEPDFDYYDYND